MKLEASKERGGAVRVLVVDPNAAFLRSASSFVQELPGVASVACANSGMAALRRCVERRFDLVVTEIAMPGMNGLETIRRLHHLSPTTCLLGMTLYDSDWYRKAAVAGGALGVIPKGQFGQEISALISAMNSGGRPCKL